MVKVYASTSERDTDFTAKLVDVHSDGGRRKHCDEIIRGRYRDSTTPQKLLQPGQVYEFTLDLWPTSSVFLRATGHAWMWPAAIFTASRVDGLTTLHSRSHSLEYGPPLVPFSWYALAQRCLNSVSPQVQIAPASGRGN